VSSAIGSATTARQIAVGALNNAVGQGVNIGLGLQDKFSWGAVAAAAAAAPLADAASDSVKDAMAGSFSKSTIDFTAHLASGAVQQLSGVVFNGGRVDYANLVADAFGNALGNSIVSAGSPTPVRGGAGAMIGGDADELSEVRITARRIPTDVNGYRLTNNPSNAIVDAASAVTLDDQGSGQPPDELAAIVVAGTRMTPEQARVYDLRQQLIGTFKAWKEDHLYDERLKEQTLEGVSTWGRIGLSWGGIANGMYESAKSGLVGMKDLAVGQLEWERRWLGDTLHGDFSAVLDDFSSPFADAKEKAQRAE